jgi:hypothetical protein
MSETKQYLWVAKECTNEQIDTYLSILIGNDIDCYADGNTVFVDPDQWDDACYLLR